MEVSVRREHLVRGLYLVQGVVERRNTLPILANVLLESVESGVALTGTDMEVGLRGLVPAQVKKKGAVTLNARKLYEIAREVSAEEIVLKSAQVGWVDLLAGRSKFRIVSLDPGGGASLLAACGRPSAGAAVTEATMVPTRVVSSPPAAAKLDSMSIRLSVWVSVSVTSSSGSLDGLGTSMPRKVLTSSRSCR